MPTKKLRVSFDIEVEVLAAALAHGHHAMNIQAYSDEPPEEVSSPKPKLLAPKGKVMQQAILDHLKVVPKIKAREITALVVRLGYSPKSVPGQLYLLKTNKLIRRVGVATYAITKKGSRL